MKKHERMILSAQQIVCDLLASRLVSDPAFRTQWSAHLSCVAGPHQWV